MVTLKTTIIMQQNYILLMYLTKFEYVWYTNNTNSSITYIV